MLVVDFCGVVTAWLCVKNRWLINITVVVVLKTGYNSKREKQGFFILFLIKMVKPTDKLEPTDSTALRLDDTWQNIKTLRLDVMWQNIKIDQP